MKNLLLVIMTLVATVATLEASGILNILNPEPDPPAALPGLVLSRPETEELLRDAKTIIDFTELKIKREYHFSRREVMNILGMGEHVTGIFVSPTFESERINLVIGPLTKYKLADPKDVDYSYQSQSYCPANCEYLIISQTDTTD